MKITGLRRIGASLAQRVRSCAARRRLESAYARMAKDEKREKQALEWVEATFRDGADRAE